MGLEEPAVDLADEAVLVVDSEVVEVIIRIFHIEVFVCEGFEIDKQNFA